MLFKIHAAIAAQKEAQLRGEAEIAAEQERTAALGRKAMSEATTTMMATHQQALAGKLAEAQKAETKFKSRWKMLQAANRKVLEDRAAAKVALQEKLAAQLAAAASQKTLASEQELRDLVAENEAIDREIAAVAAEDARRDAASVAAITAAAATAQELKRQLEQAVTRLQDQREAHAAKFGETGAQANAVAQAARKALIESEKRRDLLAGLRIKVMDVARDVDSWTVQSLSLIHI